MGGIFSVILGVILWRITGSIWIGAVLSVIATPILEAIFKPLSNAVLMAFAKTPPAMVLRAVVGDSAAAASGMRVMVMVKNRPLNVYDPNERMLYDQLYSDGIRALTVSDAAFRYKYRYCEAVQPPTQVCVSAHNFGKGTMLRLFSRWYKTLEKGGFKVNEKDVFVHEDDVFSPSTGEKVHGAVAFLFGADVPALPTGAVQEPLDKAQLPLYTIPYDTSVYMLEL